MDALGRGRLVACVAALALLLGGGLLVHAGPALAWNADRGHVWRGDGVLKPGCAKYWYRYRVSPPRHRVWGMETFLRGPDGDTVASDALGSGFDPKRGRSVFRFCGTSTSPGRFKIVGKLTWFQRDDGIPPAETGSTTVWVEPDTFRLRRP